MKLTASRRKELLRERAKLVAKFSQLSIGYLSNSTEEAKRERDEKFGPLLDQISAIDKKLE